MKTDAQLQKDVMEKNEKQTVRAGQHHSESEGGRT